MSAPLELRNSATGKIFPAVGPVVIGVMFGFGALRGLASGANSGHVLVIALVAAGCLGLGYLIARCVQHRRPGRARRRRLSRPARLRRAGVWQNVRDVRLTSGKGSAMISFQLTEPPRDNMRYAPVNALP